MKISVITVCKNVKTEIEKTILSVITQTYHDIEYIIIDGKSTDGTLDVVEKYRNDISQIISESDTGLYNAMNKGVKRARGDYLFFLNADDVFMHDNVVTLVVEALYKNPGIDLLYGDILFLAGDTGKIYLHEYFFRDTLQFIQGSIIQQAFFFHKKVFERIGKFNEAYRICADYEWLIKALIVNKRRISAGHINIPLVTFYSGGLSTNASSREKHEKERKAVIKEYFSLPARLVLQNKLCKIIYFCRPIFVSMILRFFYGVKKIIKNKFI